MKKIISILAVLAMIMPFAGCSAAKDPGETVDAFVSALHAKNIKEAEKYVSGGFSVSDNPQVNQMAERMFIKLGCTADSFEVLSQDSAKATVSVRAVDAQVLWVAWMGEYALSIGMIEKHGDTISEEEARELLAYYLDKNLDQADYLDYQTEIWFVRENGMWKMLMNDSLKDVLTGGLITFISTMKEGTGIS